MKRIQNSLIVSCQALEDEPLHSSLIMSKMALAAKMGGAKGIEQIVFKISMKLKRKWICQLLVSSRKIMRIQIFILLQR